MPEFDQERLDLARAIQNDLAQERTLSALQARSFVRCLQTDWDVKTIQWSDNDSDTILQQARFLIRAGRVLTTVREGRPEEATLAFRRAGELLEWLARAQDKVGEEIPTALISAGCYQLGGLPAMATGLLRQIPPNDRGSRLFADFLKADFDAVLRRAAGFWNDNLEFTRRGVETRFFGEGTEESVTWFGTIELVRCIGLAAQTLRRGDSVRFSAALERLREVERLLVRTSPDDVALLAFFLRSACERFGKSTIYEPLRRLGQLNPNRLQHVNQFARTQYARGRGILWQSQRQGIERLLNDSSFALCTPTGSGKTLVANLAILKELLILEGGDGHLAPLALYIVPSRALAGEVEAKLAGELGRDFVVTGLYGGSDWGITDAWLTSDAPTVLIATVEKADALMRYLGPMLLARLKLLIVDEAHQVVLEDNDRERNSLADHMNRAIRIESFISRLLLRKPDIVRIALTAVAGGAAPPVARWIESNPDAQPVGSNYRSTRQAIGVLEVGKGSPRIELHRVNDHSLGVRGRGDVYIPLKIDPMPEPLSGIRNSLNHFTQNSILWTALHLVGDDRRILISISQRPEQTMGWFAEAFDLAGWEDIPAFEAPADGDDAALFAEARTVCIDYCGENSHEVRLLDRGIATNHGQMPQRLRRLMVALIDRSICPITVATATLTEGVNLPFDMIFLPLLKRTMFNVATQTAEEYPMTAAEFRNLSGRAGRPGAAKGMEGLTLVALPVAPSTTAKGQLPTQRRQVRDRRQEYDDLIRRLEADAGGEGNAKSPLSVLLRAIKEQAMRLPGVDDNDDFLQWLEVTAPEAVSPNAGQAHATTAARLADRLDELDTMILAAVEETAAISEIATTPANAEAMLTQLWQRTFTQVAQATEDWMEQAFIQRGRAMVETIYPDADERKRLYDYGYSPHVGRRFEPVARTILELLQETEGYGTMQPGERLAVFVALGEAVADDGGYGFSIRDTELGRTLYANWHEVLSWWMGVPGAAAPAPRDLRAWQIFTSDNFEFRLGVAIGAVVARAWSEGTDDPLDTPTIDTWKDTTGLPWFAFWAKELLRWGTLDPFVAFTLSLGIAKSRPEAEEIREQYLAWLDDELEDWSSEDQLDPSNLLAWSRTLRTRGAGPARNVPIAADLEGTDGRAGRYAVMPVRSQKRIRWLDASGFRLAVSAIPESFPTGFRQSNDYDLLIENGEVTVMRVF
ncbi:DEAD/DEAH box helicase [Sinorhizobium medicae]|uniref:DEAD/DEAH box helicase n=1 Tax=Sinorhizobium medicae TaxID=110321 RepID=UPI000FDC181C|nr:DEAD/DEAH box helicase [Sinorhizobium medicae]MDW9959471.1 DEAD/DEAH box helicase [Sinorhizobium meliloti]RVI91879.1 DEAD/DEAH box helicase [Sinorhizobium medicae]